MTFQEMYTAYGQISGDVSAANIARGKRDINIGDRLFHSFLNNYFVRKSKSANLEEGIDTYQLPPDCKKITGINYLDSNGRERPVTQIRSEMQWTALKTSQQSSNRIIHYFVRGADEIVLYPTPSQDVDDGLIIYYKPVGRQMTQDDYTTGTITMTDGEVTVTGVGTAFTDSMIGRVLRDTDGSSGYEYRIAERTNGTEILLEEPFSGISGGGKTYLIGESPLYPLEFHFAPVDYALQRYFELNGDPKAARYHESNFINQYKQCQEMYASSSNSMVVTDENFGYDWSRDNSFSVTETN